MTPRLHDFAVGRQRAADILIRDLTNQILERRWGVGDRIGSEDDLVHRFGHSRPILREALRILERDGVITVKSGPGGGVFCSKPDIQPLVRSLQLYGSFHNLTPESLADGRVELEVATVRLAVLRGNDAELSDVELAAAEWKRSCEVNDASAAASANVIFHRSIAVAASSPMLLIMMEVAESLLFASAYWPSDLFLGMHAGSHDGILRALQDRNADAGAAHMREHLKRFRHRAIEMEREGWFARPMPRRGGDGIESVVGH